MMRELIDLIRFKAKLNETKIAEELGLSRQALYNSKQTKDKYKLLVTIVKKFNLDWNEVGKALEKDYK